MSQLCVLDRAGHVADTNFTGLFPTARLAVDGGAVVVTAWSALVPQQIANASLPAVHFDVRVANRGGAARTVAVALSFQDVIGWGIFDATAGPYSFSHSLTSQRKFPTRYF